MTSTLLHRLAHLCGGPTYAVRRPDGCLAVRVAFDGDELVAAVGPCDDVIGTFIGDRAVLIDLESPKGLRLALWRAGTATGRCWTYDGERREGRPVWRMGEGLS